MAAALFALAAPALSSAGEKVRAGIGNVHAAAPAGWGAVASALEREIRGGLPVSMPLPAAPWPLPAVSTATLPATATPRGVY
jgi:hypothetical protein